MPAAHQRRIGADADTLNPGKRTHSIEPKHGQPALGQGAEIPTGALDPEQLSGGAGHRISLGALGGSIATRIVGGGGIGWRKPARHGGLNDQAENRHAAPAEEERQRMAQFGL